MSSAQRYDRIAFVASAGVEAQAALAQLTEIYGNCEPDTADIVVALTTVCVNDTCGLPWKLAEPLHERQVRTQCIDRLRGRRGTPARDQRRCRREQRVRAW